ncbi:Calx-beta domain-containing protein [Actinoplanes sp. NPDC051346]|uniref:Calx-beta domain-containing protein n=1 Tax=Actinoplanes sp. NPDC051346 TaxID=3155048 RepID=UPI003438185A
MRYSPAHAAKSGSVPFMLRGPKSVRTVLSAAVAGVIGLVPAVMITSPAQAAIADYTVSSPTITEGGDLVFVITRDLNAAAAEEETLTWTIDDPDDGAGVDDDDLEETSGTVTFSADATTPFPDQTEVLTIGTNNDTLDEEQESFKLILTDESATDITVAPTGTILDNDEAPTYTIEFDDASTDEGAGSVQVTAKLSAPSGKAVSIPITTKDGTAKVANDDYTPILAGAGETLDIAAGDTESVPVAIALNDDDLYEEAEQTFTVVGAADTTVKGTATGTVTILDNEDVPELTIAGSNATEGSPITFTVTMSARSEREVTASYSTADGPGADTEPEDVEDHGTATAGSDYTAVPAGTVKFAATTTDTAGAQTTTFNVNTRIDNADELDPEDMHVTLASPTVAKLGAADEIVATGEIDDDNDAPVVDLLPSTLEFSEGNSGKNTKTFTARLAQASGQQVTVNYNTVSDTAIQGQDFTRAAGSLVFAPGETSKTFTVDLVGDTIYETDEDFDIRLTGTGIFGPVTETVTIENDDKLPTFTVSAMSVAEGDEGTVAVFPVKLSNAADTAMTFTVNATADSATKDAGDDDDDGDVDGDDSVDPGDIDYLEPGNLVIPAGQTTGYIYFLVNGDDVYETNETLNIEVDPTSANVTDGNKDADVSITNDDSAPTLTIMNTSGNEDETVQVRGMTAGVAQDDMQFNITFVGGSVDGSTAASSGDFTASSPAAVTIEGGTFSGSIIDVGTAVELEDDATSEGAETIVVSGTGFGAGTVNKGVLTIAASDGGTTPPPASDKPTLAASAAFRLGAGSLKLTGKAAAGATVKLWGTPIGSDVEGDWEDLGSIAASSAGTYSFMPEFTTTGWWFRTTVGDAQSNTVKVNLKQDPDFFVRSSAKGAATLSVFGDPRVGGLSVRFLRANKGGTWSTVGSGTLDANGKLVKTLTGLKSGSSILYKALVLGDGDVGMLTNYSKSARVSVR